MRIDAHHTFESGPSHPPGRLSTILDRNRFDGSVLIQSAPSNAETDLGLAAAASLEFIMAVAAWVDLKSADLPNRLDELQTSAKFKGVVCRLTAEMDPAQLNELARRCLTVDLVLPPQDLSAIPLIMDRVPDLKLIVCHLGRPSLVDGNFEIWASQIETISKIPNVAMKISGLLTLNRPNPWSVTDLKPFVQHAIASFGPDRLMFGSDWPSCLAGGTWKESLAAFTQSIGAHSIDFREKLLGGTAARLYKLLT